MESPHPIMNGEHPEDPDVMNIQDSLSSQLLYKPGSDFEDNDSRHGFNFTLVTEEYAQILSSWPKVLFGYYFIALECC